MPPDPAASLDRSGVIVLLSFWRKSGVSPPEAASSPVLLLGAFGLLRGGNRGRTPEVGSLLKKTTSATDPYFASFP